MKQFSYIVKLNKLSAERSEEICGLQKVCERLNHENFYIYLDEDDGFYGELKCFHLFYTEDKLVGFLSFFIQDEDSVCISGCVLPQYRKKHIFTCLYKSALEELSSYPKLLKGIEFHLPDGNLGLHTPAVNFLNKNSLFLHHKEYLMQYDLTQMTAACFADDLNTEYDENDSEFTLWLGDTYIGGCFIYISDYSSVSPPDSVTIYDYMILQDHRQKGYGSMGLLSILRELKKMNIKHVRLHVSGLNKIAHSMYIRCGFTVQSEFSVFSAEC